MPGLCVVQEEMMGGKTDPVPVVAEFKARASVSPQGTYVTEENESLSADATPGTGCRGQRAAYPCGGALRSHEHPQQPFLIAPMDSTGH